MVVVMTMRSSLWKLSDDDNGDYCEKDDNDNDYVVAYVELTLKAVGTLRGAPRPLPTVRITLGDVNN